MTLNTIITNLNKTHRVSALVCKIFTSLTHILHIRESDALGRCEAWHCLMLLCSQIFLNVLMILEVELA